MAMLIAGFRVGAGGLEQVWLKMLTVNAPATLPLLIAVPLAPLLLVILLPRFVIVLLSFLGLAGGYPRFC